MPNTREKLIELLAISPYLDVLGGLGYWAEAADHLIANGVIFDKDTNVPTICENCTHHDTESCPENRVWCKYLRRYMKMDGYCSFGEKE